VGIGGMVLTGENRSTWEETCHSATLCVSVIKTSKLMLYREIIDVCSQIHTKHTNTLCGQNVEMLNVKLAVYIFTVGL